MRGRHRDRVALLRGAGHDSEAERELERRDLREAGQTPTAPLWQSSSVNTALVSGLGLTQLDLPSPEPAPGHMESQLNS